MAKDKDKKQDAGDDELDLASLSALVRPSDAGSTPAEKADKDDNDSKLDLRALVASVPPPAPVDPEPVKAAAAPVEAKRDEAPAKSTKKGAAPAKSAAQPEKAAVVATPAPAASGGGGMGIGIGLGFGLAIAAVAYFAMNSGSPATPPTAGSEGPTTLAVADEPRADHLVEAPTAIEERDHESEPVAAVVDPGAEVEDSADDEVAPESDDDEEVEADDHEEETAHESETRHAASARTRRGARGTTTTTTAATTATTATATTVATAEPPPPATTTATARRGGGLDSVLDQALGTSRTPPPSTTTTTARTARTAPAGDLPDQPSQADVRRVLGPMLSRVRTCAGEQVGMVNFTIVVRSDGSVVSAAAGGSPFGGTPQGSCMEGVLRGATFPAFRQAQFRVTYPMRI